MQTKEVELRCSKVYHKSKNAECIFFYFFLAFSSLFYNILGEMYVEHICGSVYILPGLYIVIKMGEQLIKK